MSTSASVSQVVSSQMRAIEAAKAKAVRVQELTAITQELRSITAPAPLQTIPQPDAAAQAVGSATKEPVAVPAKPQPLSKVPSLLKSIPNWIWWRLETKDGKPTKVPHVAGNWSRHASSTDPFTWTTFENAIQNATLSQTQGVGFVIHGAAEEKKIVGFDLDGCRNPETGELTAWAQDLIEEIGSYTEITPSETGVRVWVIGDLPDGTRVFTWTQQRGSVTKLKSRYSTAPDTSPSPETHTTNGVGNKISGHATLSRSIDFASTRAISFQQLSQVQPSATSRITRACRFSIVGPSSQPSWGCCFTGT